MLDCDARSRYASATLGTDTCPVVWTLFDSVPCCVGEPVVTEPLSATAVFVSRSTEVELRHTGRTRLTSIGRWFEPLHNKGIACLGSDWLFVSGEPRPPAGRAAQHLVSILTRNQSPLHRSVTQPGPFILFWKLRGAELVRAVCL